MPSYGQLLHVDEIKRRGQHYRLAVFRTDGGFIGKWSCATCRSDHGTHLARNSVDLCVYDMKQSIDEHHLATHSG